MFNSSFSFFVIINFLHFTCCIVINIFSGLSCTVVLVLFWWHKEELGTYL